MKIWKRRHYSSNKNITKEIGWYCKKSPLVFFRKRNLPNKHIVKWSFLKNLIYIKNGVKRSERHIKHREEGPAVYLFININLGINDIRRRYYLNDNRINNKHEFLKNKLKNLNFNLKENT